MRAARRSPPEQAALERAKARLDRLDFYPLPVRTDRVRILHAPWFFRIPGLRRFVGYELGPLILSKRPLEAVSDDLIVHELCHVLQWQHKPLRMPLSYLFGYAQNPHELEAQRAAEQTS